MWLSKTVNLITIQANVQFKDNHTAVVILSLAHPEHMWAICLIGKAYRHTFSYRADAYILSHYRPIQIIPVDHADPHQQMAM